MSEDVAQQAPGRTQATDEVLRRVGRNLVIFQQVEHTLKFLTTHGRFHAPASQFAERFAKHAESISTKSMGDPAGTNATRRPRTLTRPGSAFASGSRPTPKRSRGMKRS